jgi:ankyrin repeat protein
MGNHLYHEAASHGNCKLPPSSHDVIALTKRNEDEIIDLLLDQPSFECDPVNRLEGDTPLHTAIRWLNAEPPAQRSFGKALIEMMLEAGSNPRVKNKGGLTALQLVDPRNTELRDLIQQHEYTNQNAGDFITVDDSVASNKTNHVVVEQDQESDDDAEFSGSDDEERAEWERRRKEKKR